MIRSRGFSLVELAMAVLIIGLLLAGALVPLSSQIDTRNIAETQRNMDAIREAIIGFAQANGRLPCPADGTIKAGVAGAGVEATSGSAPNTACTQVYGVVPWSTLGVPETDGWGRRFSYQVTAIFADGIGLGTFNNTFPVTQNPPCPTPVIPTPTQSSFALCSMGSLTVNTRSEQLPHVANPIGLSLAAVIISHGKNGGGAFTPTGGTTLTALQANAGADETANAAHIATTSTFVSRVQTPSQFGSCNDATGTFCEFDDIVVMISSNVLMARMIAAGKRP
jgi:prepilin-type N-terminal cleavage/methylation domain-containing protein